MTYSHMERLKFNTNGRLLTLLETAILDGRLAGIRQESSECREHKRKQQISPPKKFYLAEHLIKRKVLPNNYMRVSALSKWSVLSLSKAV